GTPRGVKNCDEGGCPRCSSNSPSGHNLRECICCHGEENAIVQAACHGISVKDSTIYSTYSPCLLCSKMIINAGIKEVVFRKKYHIESTAEDMMRSVGIKVRQIE
ncbi:MAG TPA: deaminase, partial [Victivallales bacterium]|nr:deaminase [Victivallales bacterium]